MSNQQFDGVSFISQNKKECVVQLRLCAMKTSKAGFPPKCKPTNTELPAAEISEEFVTVKALVKEEDGTGTKTYEWVKRHQGKISQCKVKPIKNEYLEVTLSKTESKDWLKIFVESLLDL